MKNNKFKITCLVLLLFNGMAMAQSGVHTAGGEAIGLDGTVSYSIGQSHYLVYSDANYSLAEGVQQPYEINAIAGVNDLTSPISNINIYPNPTVHTITIELAEYDGYYYGYRLIDSQGKQVKTNTINDSNTVIPVEYLAPGTYNLSIFNDEQNQTFQIIKY